MNLAIWDIESSSASTDFGSIIEIGGVLVNEDFKELDRFNLRCRLPEGEIPQAMAHCSWPAFNVQLKHCSSKVVPTFVWLANSIPRSKPQEVSKTSKRFSRTF